MVRRQRLRVIVVALTLTCILVYCAHCLRFSFSKRPIAAQQDQYSANGQSPLEPDKGDADTNLPEKPGLQLTPALIAESLTTTTSTAPITAFTSSLFAATVEVPELPIIRIYAFGDSYTSYGFSLDQTAPTLEYAHGNRLPISEELCPSDQLTTCSYKWLDFVLSYYSAGSKISLEQTDIGKEEIRPTALAWNFARGSSTVDGGLIWPEYPAARSLSDQVKEFTEQDERKEAQPQTDELGRSATSIVSHENARSRLDLYTIFFGINDVANTAQKEGVNMEELYTAVIDTYVGEMEHLYDRGARNFLLFNVPPVDRTPELLDSSEEARNQVQTAVALFNMLLEGIAVGHPGSQTGLSFAERRLDSYVKLLDMQLVFHEFLNADSERAWCVQDQSENLDCAWLDKFHPVASLQRVMGTEVVKVMQSIVGL